MYFSMNLDNGKKQGNRKEENKKIEKASKDGSILNDAKMDPSRPEMI